MKKQMAKSMVSQNTGDIQLDESVSESLSTMAEIGQEGETKQSTRKPKQIVSLST